MKTPILLSAITTGPSNTAVRYHTFSSGPLTGTWATTMAAAQVPIAESGTISDLVVRFPTVLTAGKSYVLVLQVNGVDTALTVTVNNTSGVIVSDRTNSVNVTEGDLVNWKLTPTGTPEAQGIVQISFVFNGSKSVIFGGMAASSAAGHLKLGARTAVSPVEDESKSVFPTSGLVSKLRVNLGTAAPGVGNSRTFTLRVNGVDTSLTLTISNNATIGNVDLGGSGIAIAKGDLVTLNQTISGTPISSEITYCLDWAPTVDGESIHFSTGNGSQSTAAVRYMSTDGGYNSAETTETNAYSIAPIDTIWKAMAVASITAPGVGKSRTVKGRIAGVDTLLSVVVNDNEVIDYDNTNIVSVPFNSLLSLSSTPTGTPNASVVSASSVMIVPGANGFKVPLIAPAVSATISNAAARFGTFVGGSSYGSGPTVKLPFTEAGVLSNLKVRAETPLAQGSYAVVVVKDGVNTTLTATLDNVTNTQFAANNSTQVTVLDGSQVYTSVTPTGTPTAQNGFAISAVFTPHTVGKSVVFAGMNGSASAGFFSLGIHMAVNATEANATNRMPCDGVFEKMRVHLNTAPGAGTSVTFLLRVNGVDTALSATISDTNLDALVVASVAVSKGDLVCISKVLTSGVSASSQVGIGMTFAPTIAGENPVFSNILTLLSSSVDSFAPVNGGTAAQATESTWYGVAPCKFSIKRYYGKLVTAPGAAKSRTNTVRINNANSLITHAFSGAAQTTSEDIVNTAIVAENDLLDTKSTPAGTPTATASMTVSMVLDTINIGSSYSGGLSLMGVG